MNSRLIHAFALSSLGCALLAGSLQAQAKPENKAKFDAPRRIRAGDTYVGATCMYPSPVLHDMDGDGRLDIVVGDLTGRVRFASRVEGTGDEIRYSEEQPLEDKDGKPLKFNNW